MVAKKKKIIRDLTLIDNNGNLKKGTLLESDDVKNFSVPNYIKENLKHILRPYQEKALFNLNWSQKGTLNEHNHLLFNMATGSGKTDLMSAVMLYMYTEFGYNKFLFTSNTKSVVAKTQENFLNPASTKYLFSSPIVIYGQRIEIKMVNRFPLNSEEGVIYLKLSTIQSLANELGNIRENGLTYEELEKQKIIVLADEAHHFNASTKAKKDEEKSWEYLLNRIRQSNSMNKQFEFTATIDIQKDEVYEKYKDKIIYKYDLNTFMNDGYSKKVYRLESNNDDETKMFNAILLSQYRKRIAKKYKIDDFKPVILFKSNRVKVSNDFRDSFIELISDMTPSNLHDFIVKQLKVSDGETLKKVYEYWLSQDMDEVVAELKHDFQPLTIVNVNDSPREGILGDGNDISNLNTLEDIDNPIRTIFAVAKLTEGWDVLNLYDVVRLGEQPTTITQTTSEAQLIGRGARYNPFVYNNEKSYKRRFDNDIQNEELQILESLHYHTVNDVSYIDNLRKAFDKLNLVSEGDNGGDFDIYTAEVKLKFKSSNAYKRGKLYYDKVEEIPDTDYRNLGNYGVNLDVIEIDIIEGVREHEYDEKVVDKTQTRQLEIADFSDTNDNRLLKKAIAKDKFFRYSELSKYLPLLKSMNEFMTSPNWLGNIKVRVNVALGVDELNNNRKLEAVDLALGRIKTQIKKNYQKQRGTNEFISKPLKDVVVDYKKRVSNNFTGTIQENVLPNDMRKFDWFVYNYAIVDGLEKSLIDLISNFVYKFKESFDEVYLIRNEETINKLKLHEFSTRTGVSHYQGFMPDFLLYLGKSDVTYQVYIEPKGDQLLERDQWKEDLLESIRPNNIQLIGENNDVRLYGVKFFTKGDGRKVEQELHDLKILND